MQIQDEYVIVAPKWMSAPQYADEVARFIKDTGYRVVFAEDFITPPFLPHSQFLGEPNDNQES